MPSHAFCNDMLQSRMTKEKLEAEVKKLLRAINEGNIHLAKGMHLIKDLETRIVVLMRNVEAGKTVKQKKKLTDAKNRKNS
jgi:hypothetical protein